MEKAALTLAVAAVSPIINKLGDLQVASYFGGDITKEELRHLQTIILPKIRTVIDAAEKIDAAKLQPWLTELQAAAYEAQDILDLYEYNKIKSEVSPLSAYFKKFRGKAKELLAPLLLKTGLKKSFEKLQESANEADKLIPLLGLVNSTTPEHSATNSVTVSGLSDPVFGRDRERDHLVSMLIKEPHESSSNGRNVVVHAIHSIGGAGKTTLAQYVYNDGRIGDHFDLKIWIHVSRTFDLHRITGEIIQSVENSDSPPVGNLDVLHRRLKEDLKSRKFLLVLDDIWIEDKERDLWDRLLIPLTKNGEVGSRILVTTRMAVQNLRVKSENIVPLAELKVADCWSILKYYAFGDVDKEIEDPQLTDVGKQILCKLKNSPLAARLVGCLLGKNVSVDAWRRILNSDTLGETLVVILLSFQYLPSHLQRCFAICSLYPKNHMFDSSTTLLCKSSDVDRLIQFWIAHGYVEATGNESLEDKGRQYFDDLVSYSLFQRDSTCTSRYVMHDLVHDATEKVSKDYCFRIEGDGSVSIPATLIHLSVVRGKLHLCMPNILKLVNLRTFVIFPSFEVEFNNPIEHTTEMFKKLKKLRVLRFGWCWMPELNSSIGKLKHLRDLQLRGGKKLSELLGTLYHLQFLELESIDRMPNSLKNLEKLRCAYSKIEDIGKLNYLQELKVYDAIKYGGLQQLGNLQRIKGWLTIKGLENVNKAGATSAKLKAKSRMKRLELQWDNIREAYMEDMLLYRDEGVLEGLEPHPNLQELRIEGYRGAKPPSWMGIANNLTSLGVEPCSNLMGILCNQACLPNLTSLELWSCSNLIGLPNLGGCLKVLKIELCPKLIQMSAFPCNLEYLMMNDWPGAEAFLSSAISSSSSCGGDDPKDEELQRSSFPLKHLKIWNCSGFEEKTVNGLLMNNRFTSLSSLDLWDLPLITSLCLSPHLTTLKDIHIVGLENLSSIQDMRSLKSLAALTVRGCPMLTAIGGGGEENITDYRLSSIGGNLDIDEPLMLPVLLQQQGLNSLAHLVIRNRTQHVPFIAEQEDVFQHLTSLKILAFWGCENIPSLPGTLERLSSLETLDVRDCFALESLPSLPPSVKSLDIHDCHPQLKEKYEAGGLLRPEIDHIPRIEID